VAAHDSFVLTGPIGGVILRLRNFKIFRELEISDLPSLIFFIGANGTGKSTLFDAFGLLKDALDNNVHTAIQKRGGYKEVVTRGHREEPIEIEIQFRMEITDSERLVTYRLEIIEDKGRAIVRREVLRYKRGRYGSPYHFLDFALRLRRNYKDVRLPGAPL
jgi:predicted ATPase